MLVDLEWLKEYVDIEVDAKELAHRLTMSGVEVEGIETESGQTVLEVSVTPNRGDCLSMVGLAREIQAITGSPFRYPAINQEENEEFSPFRVELENPGDCPRYAARHLIGVTIGPTPEWIRQRLQNCGVRPVNNVVDITNYVLLELGHPLHAFDAHTICDNKIVVRSARAGETLTTIDEKEHILQPGMLVIADSVKPVALAGIMGGIATEVKEGTGDIFLESAYFNPSSIRRTARTLGFTTEASYRFERGCDPDNPLQALNRATELILQTAGGRSCGNPIDCYPEPILPLQINLRFARIEKIIGLKIPAVEVIDILKKLKLIIKRTSEKEIQILIPPFRHDLIREIDLIEEVARLYGYHKIPASLPSGRQNRVPPDDFFSLADRARMFMTGLGFFEGINFTFTNKCNFSKLNPDADEDSFLKLKNPLNADENVLRRSLLPSLLNNLAENIRWNQSDIRFFELSYCYEPFNGSSREKQLLSGVMAGNRYVRYWKDKELSLDFYDVKGVVEALLSGLGVTSYRFEDADCSFLRPERCLQIIYNQEHLGILGELHPEFDNFEVGAVFLFELDFSAIVAHRKEEKSLKPLKNFPGITRDLAIVVPDSMSAAKIFEVMESFHGKLLKTTQLKNIYQGSPIREGYKSMAFSLFYQMDTRTLVDEEVDRLHNIIAKHLQKKLDVELR